MYTHTHTQWMALNDRVHLYVNWFVYHIWGVRLCCYLSAWPKHFASLWLVFNFERIWTERKTYANLRKYIYALDIGLVISTRRNVLRSFVILSFYAICFLRSAPFLSMAHLPHRAQSWSQIHMIFSASNLHKMKSVCM